MKYIFIKLDSLEDILKQLNQKSNEGYFPLGNISIGHSGRLGESFLFIQLLENRGFINEQHELL